MAFLPSKPHSSGLRFIAVAFALIAVVQGESFRIPRAAMAAFAGQAIATLVISVSYLASVQFIPIGLAVIIFFTFPVLIMLASPVVEGKFPGFLADHHCDFCLCRIGGGHWPELWRS